jgi:glycerophosphoryl diester phosphodiesterase
MQWWRLSHRQGPPLSSNPVGRPFVVAHRGASAVAPENTVAAFRRAVELGADAVELDVRATADGALVVHHDPHLPDGRAIATCDRPALPPSVPTLAEALEACAPLRVNVEIKQSPREPGFDAGLGIVDRTVAELVAVGAVERCIVSSFHRPSAQRAADLGVPSALLTTVLPAAADLPAFCAGVARAGLVALNPMWPSVRAELVAACAADGLAIWTWTVDDPDEHRRLADLGVDALITNVPDVALAALGAVSRVVPPPG